MDKAADAVIDYALEITKTLTNLVGGGSEMFSGRLLKDTPREMYKADLQYCERRLRDRFRLAADRADEQLRKCREADSDNARLRARVSELEAAMARIVDRANEHSPGPTPDRETVYAIHAIAVPLLPAPPVGDR